MGFRRFQHEFDQFMRNPQCGTAIRRLLCDVCPGGGKSTLGPIFAHGLRQRGIIERLCWVSPRVALCRQAEHAFIASWLRDLTGHSLEIMAAPGNPINPDAGTFGYATTYDAVDARSDLHVNYFRKHRTGLILDEPHHVIDGSERHRKLTDLSRLAPVLLLMSGTFQRHDEQPVAFIDYQPIAHGTGQAVLSNTADQQVFRYSWRDALDDHAIIRLVFHHVDGTARWRNADGAEQQVDKISETDDDDARSAIFTVLHEDYALELLNEAVAHFLAWKQRHPRAKFLCVAPRKRLANRYLTHIKRLGLPHCGIATSDDTGEALRNIERLKGNERPHLDALVSVAMAYEGMDCPPITHLAVLTHIRSMPWLYQAFARATRFDEDAGEWMSQTAHAFVPDDPLMNDVIATIRDQQAPFMRERAGSAGGLGGNGAGDRSDRVVPMDGAIGAIRASQFETGDATTDKEYRDLCAAAERHGVSASPLALKRFLDDYLAAHARDDEAPQPSPGALTPSQRCAQYRRWIDAHVQAVAERAGERAGERAHEINRDLIRRCGGDRDSLSEAQLAQLWENLPRWYPL